MIKYQLFKYPFLRYFLYNLLYSGILCLVLIFLYLLVLLSIVTNIDDPSIVDEIINYGITNFIEYETILRYMNNLSIILIVVFTIICNIGYVFMIKLILTKLFFMPYKNITLSNKRRNISWGSATLFAFSNSILSLGSSWCILCLWKLVQYNYKTILYSLQIISFIVSWYLTYVLLNKFMEYHTRIKLKIL